MPFHFVGCFRFLKYQGRIADCKDKIKLILLVPTYMVFYLKTKPTYFDFLYFPRKYCVDA